MSISSALGPTRRRVSGALEEGRWLEAGEEGGEESQSNAPPSRAGTAAGGSRRPPTAQGPVSAARSAGAFDRDGFEVKQQQQQGGGVISKSSAPSQGTPSLPRQISVMPSAMAAQKKREAAAAAAGSLAQPQIVGDGSVGGGGGRSSIARNAPITRGGSGAGALPSAPGGEGEEWGRVPTGVSAASAALNSSPPAKPLGQGNRSVSAGAIAGAITSSARRNGGLHHSRLPVPSSSSSSSNYYSDLDSSSLDSAASDGDLGEVMPPAARGPTAFLGSGVFDLSGPRIKVVVRKRPINRREVGAGELDVVRISSRRDVQVHEIKRKVDLTRYTDVHEFMVDDVFDETVATEEVYRHTAQPLIGNLFAGGNATCFAYGQTGSGKTFTMMGSVKEGGKLAEEEGGECTSSPSLAPRANAPLLSLPSCRSFHQHHHHTHLHAHTHLYSSRQPRALLPCSP